MSVEELTLLALISNSELTGVTVTGLDLDTTVLLVWCWDGDSMHQVLYL